MIAIRGSNNVHTTGTVTATERDGGRQRRSRRAQYVYDVENVEEDGEEDEEGHVVYNELKFGRFQRVLQMGRGVDVGFLFALCVV